MSVWYTEILRPPTSKYSRTSSRGSGLYFIGLHTPQLSYVLSGFTRTLCLDGRGSLCPCALLASVLCWTTETFFLPPVSTRNYQLWDSKHSCICEGNNWIVNHVTARLLAAKQNIHVRSFEPHPYVLVPDGLRRVDRRLSEWYVHLVSSHFHMHCFIWCYFKWPSC
jgi:hypothetical protein